MKEVKTLLLCILCISFVATKAQQNEQLFANEKKAVRVNLVFEIGPEFLSGTFNSEKWPVRRDIGYNSSYSSSYVQTEISAFYAGAKSEFVFWDGRSSVATGLRYGFTSSDILQSNSYSNYFYLRYDSNGSDTKYARVKGMSERYDMLAVPLEFKWAPIHFSNFNIYLKAGFEFNFRISSKVEIDFVNESMEADEEFIFDYVGGVETKSFYARPYAGFGMNYEGKNGHGVAFDVLFSNYFSDNNFALIIPDAYTGIQFSYYMPLSK